MEYVGSLIQNISEYFSGLNPFKHLISISYFNSLLAHILCKGQGQGDWDEPVRRTIQYNLCPIKL